MFQLKIYKIKPLSEIISKNTRILIYMSIFTHFPLNITNLLLEHNYFNCKTIKIDRLTLRNEVLLTFPNDQRF
jgi:hypothetical protein